MHGHRIPLSPMRRFMGDLLRASTAVPSVPVQRRMFLGNLVAARSALSDRPLWTAVFTKAYARVVASMPELRRVYVKFPWPHLYEYEKCTASIAVEREHAGERAVFFGRIKQPDHLPLAQLSQAIQRLRGVPVTEHPEFRRSLLLGNLPWPLRRTAWWLGLNVSRLRSHCFGTFGVSVYSGLGAESLHPLSPVTTTLNYGVIGRDGTVAVRVVYDHRVMDGATVARALKKLESTLRDDILTELTAGSSLQARAA
jgi:hypothetical protein